MFSLILAAGLASGTADCSCATTFSEVARAVETHYAGYIIKLPDEKSRATYDRFRDLLLADARATTDVNQCRILLDAYLDFFADDHLFVGAATQRRSTSADASATTPVVAAGTAVQAPEIPNLAARWTPEKVEFRLRREPNLDPVEGLWRDTEGQFAIVYDDAVPRGEYVAFRFSYRYGVRPGEIFAFLRPLDDGTYQVLYKDGDHWERAHANLVKGTGVLTFADKGWQRTTEPATQMDDEGSLFAEEESEPNEDVPSPSGDPLAPRFREISDGVYYLKLASFMPRFREPLQEIIATHGDALSKANGLIIDVRGNSGGDAIYFPLAEYLLTGPIVVHEDNAVLASDWNIAYFEKLRETLGEQGTYLDPVLACMRANQGEIVPYLDERREAPANLKEGPRQVVVLQDRGVGSAAEAFLLHANQSGKVVTMGEASKGNIDYQQVNMRTLGCGDYAINFGWPLYLRTRDLPDDSLNDSGIAPDVRLSPVHGDWIEYAERWLQTSGK